MKKVKVNNIDSFCMSMCIENLWTTKPAENLYHFKGNFLGFPFEFFVTCNSNDTYIFQYETPGFEDFIQNACPQFETFVIETAIK